MLILYPDIKPFQEHRLEVDEPHVLYLEESGNKDGIPVLYVHGGPGSGCEAFNRRFFDPEKFRIVLFDQRGAGKSTPHAELRGNTTQNLIKDMETIREHLGIDRWMLFGGSWGSTLSLAYAEAYPERVLGMILRGIFLCREQDLRWFYQEGASRIFPDAWEEYLKPIPEDEQNDIVAAFYKRLTGGDELARMGAAKAWSLWEAHCATLRPNHTILDHFAEPHMATSLARIESHYFINNGFLNPNQLIEEAHKIADIPGIIVHGRYDMICPLDNAFELNKVWPSSELHIIRDAGHSAMEPGIVDALVRATDDMAKLFEEEFL